jgi:putative ABC transport system substrate-binding protein
MAAIFGSTTVERHQDVGQIPVMVSELLSLKPDVILAHTQLVVAAFQRETKNIPIVFVAITDPVASGFVQSLSHPGRNITGFSNSTQRL